MGRCYCPVADGIGNFIVVRADVIAQWQMEWPLQGVRFPPGRCCSQGGQMDRVFILV